MLYIRFMYKQWIYYILQVSCISHVYPGMCMYIPLHHKIQNMFCVYPCAIHKVYV